MMRTTLTIHKPQRLADTEIKTRLGVSVPLWFVIGEGSSNQITTFVMIPLGNISSGVIRRCAMPCWCV
jgi:hypothetical protein